MSKFREIYDEHSGKIISGIIGTVALGIVGFFTNLMSRALAWLSIIVLGGAVLIRPADELSERLFMNDKALISVKNVNSGRDTLILSLGDKKRLERGDYELTMFRNKDGRKEYLSEEEFQFTVGGVPTSKLSIVSWSTKEVFFKFQQVGFTELICKGEYDNDEVNVETLEDATSTSRNKLLGSLVLPLHRGKWLVRVLERNSMLWEFPINIRAHDTVSIRLFFGVVSGRLVVSGSKTMNGYQIEIQKKKVQIYEDGSFFVKGLKLESFYPYVVYFPDSSTRSGGIFNDSKNDHVNQTISY